MPPPPVVSRLLTFIDAFYPVSMVDGQLFNLLAALAAILRKKTNRPFGGIQVTYSWNSHF